MPFFQSSASGRGCDNLPSFFKGSGRVFAPEPLGFVLAFFLELLQEGGDQVVGAVYAGGVEGGEIDSRCAFGIVAEGLADHAEGDVDLLGYAGP